MPSESHRGDLSDSLVGTGNIDKAAIFNSEGTSVWAASPDFKVRGLVQLSPCEYWNVG